jgi:hypothetical protein
MSQFCTSITNPPTEYRSQDKGDAGNLPRHGDVFFITGEMQTYAVVLRPKKPGPVDGQHVSPVASEFEFFGKAFLVGGKAPAESYGFFDSETDAWGSLIPAVSVWGRSSTSVLVAKLSPLDVLEIIDEDSVKLALALRQRICRNRSGLG